MSEAGWFAGDHGPEGDWKSLKGRMLTPPELPYDVQDKNMGDARFNGTSGSIGWAKDTIVTTGMTHGGGTMAK
jgi:hypothetical protein